MGKERYSRKRRRQSMATVAHFELMENVKVGYIDSFVNIKNCWAIING
jgi:hypothetical protein